MSSQTFVAPSKTFLLGEYVALSGGPTLLIATEPVFSLHIDTAKMEKPIFADQSPAGKLWQQHKAQLSQTKMTFHDPYAGLGGFGASGAEFILLARYLGWQDPWQLWQLYRTYAAQENSIPSGADIMLQAVGGLVYFHAQQQQLEKRLWPFPELSIALIHTGKKLATHTHLQSLAQKDFSILHQIIENAYQALKTPSADLFINAIKDYAKNLLILDLVASHTKILLKQLEQQPLVLASKGCGALGSDVVLAIIATATKDQFIAWAKQQSLSLVFCDNQFAKGLLE